ncbi:cytochrome P450 2A13-like [Phyllobates terribilis]|uniref:cytochrome P450 2A13-like n=1 Tax=Phyllobates terribilis TaxID=111132 RepID=UPI003CCA8DD7
MELVSELRTLFLGILFTLVLYIYSWRKNIKKKNMPPGPPPLPFLGTTLHVDNKEMPESLMQLSETYGPVFTIYLSNTPVVVLIGYDCVKEALLDNGDVFSMRGPSEIGDLLFKDYGVILTNGERWKQLRRFSLSNLRRFGMGTKSLEERVQEEARYLTEEIKKTRGNPFDPAHVLTSAVCNVLCSVVFGDRFDYQDVKFRTIYTLLKELTLLMSTSWGMFLNLFPNIVSRISGPHQTIFTNLEKLRDFISKSLENHKVTLDPNCPHGFLDSFLIKMEEEKNNPKTEFHFDNLSGTVIDLFFAGTETTSVTLQYGLLYLLKYPYVERKIHVEVDLVIGQDRCPSLEDQAQMPYTNAVIHEIQRFADITPMGLSHATVQNTTFRGYHIPKGTVIFPLLTSVLKDPKYFKNPQQFDPTNFLNVNGSFRKNDASVPFSLGTRSCIGESLARMILFLFLTNILQKFTLKPILTPDEINITPEPNRNMAVPRTYKMYVIPRRRKSS